MELGFTIAFTFCAILLLLAVRSSTTPWPHKVVLTLSLVIVVCLFYRGLIHSLGWPVDDRPLGVLLIDGVDIREPDGEFTGIIYVWYIDASETADKPGVPRAIHIPYDKATHQKLAKAAEQTSKGIPTYMQFGQEEGAAGQGRPEATPSAQRQDSTPREGSDQSGKGELDFVPPPRTVPEKAP